MTIRPLVDSGALVVLGTDAGARKGSGRPAEFLALDPKVVATVGLDYGRSRAWFALSDATGALLACQKVEFSDDCSWEDKFSLVVRAVQESAANDQLSLDSVARVVVGIPGAVLSAENSQTTPWAPSQVAKEATNVFQSQFRASVTVDNNTRLSALAEAKNIGAEARNVTYVSLSHGVGGAIISDGGLVLGATGLAGEVGHIRVARPGKPCRCGSSGCLETVVSVPAVLERIRLAGCPVRDLQDLARLAAEGAPIVQSIMREVGATLGQTLAGPLASASRILFDSFEETLIGETLQADGLLIEVQPAGLGDNAGALGALVLGEPQFDIRSAT